MEIKSDISNSYFNKKTIDNKAYINSKTNDVEKNNYKKTPDINTSSNKLKLGSKKLSLIQKPPKDSEMKEGAKKFEGMFLSYMLETVFDQMPENDISGENSAFKSFWIQSMAEKMSETGIGIADMIYKQMKRNECTENIPKSHIKLYDTQKIMKKGDFYA